MDYYEYRASRRRSIRVELINKLKRLQKTATETGAAGQLTIRIAGSGLSDTEWDSLIDSIDLWPKYKHNFEVCKGIDVKIINDD